MNKLNIRQTGTTGARQIAGIPLAGGMSCSYCRAECGDGTVRYKGITVCPKCFRAMAQLFFAKDFDFIANSGGQNLGLD